MCSECGPSNLVVLDLEDPLLQVKEILVCLQGGDSGAQWWDMYPMKLAKVDEIKFFMKDWNNAEGYKITVVLIQNLISCRPKSKYRVRRGLPN